jgi:uncharacterized protein DUF5658
MRVARLPHLAASFCVLAICSTSAAAEERRGLLDDVTTAAAQSAAAVPNPSPARVTGAPDRRPAALVPLYASFIGLQILDLHSTHDALARGGVEANPALAGLARNTVALSAVKAAGAASVIFVSEKLRKKNKAAALGLMIATNSAMAWVVQHNYRSGR